MSENCVLYLGNRLFYHKYGEGKKFILLFHGFGQDHRAFAPWVEKLKADYTLISFDLFFHGSSDWILERAFEKSDWKEILELTFKKEKIEKFEIGAFSLGGKFALTTFEFFPERIDKMILVAADGIKLNFWYQVATSFFLFRMFFKRIVTKPDLFFALVKLSQWSRLLDRSLLRFVNTQMDTEDKRRRVYNSWIYFRHLKIDTFKVAGIVNVVNCKLIAVAGKFDKVVPIKMMNPLLDKIDRKEVHVLDTGHNDLIVKSIEFL